jgi:hypothetical protein
VGTGSAQEPDDPTYYLANQSLINDTIFMSKRSGKNRYETKSRFFDPSKRPPRGVPEKVDRSSDDFRRRKDKSSEHFIPSGRTRDLPEKADRSRGDLWGHREGKFVPSFDRPKRESGFVSSDKRPLAQEQRKTVSAAALKRGFERAKDEIIGMCDEISALMASRYNIGKVELTVSFNAGGEFIGFGVGGAASILITIIPSK